MVPVTKSHVLACPPPAYALPPPVRVSSVAIGGDSAMCELVDRLLPTGMSRRRFARDLGAALNADALLWTDDETPAWARSWDELLEATRTKLVWIPLGLCCRLLQMDHALRVVRAKHKALGAKVQAGCFLTKGLALLDVIPWYESSDEQGSSHRCIEVDRELRAKLTQLGFTVVLASARDVGRASDHPVCMYRPNENGGLLVADPGPVSSAAHDMGCASPAQLILLHALGLEPIQLGQFTTPPASEHEIQTQLGELVDRYPLLAATPRSGWSVPPPEAMVRVGWAKPGTTRAKSDRPLIVIRTEVSEGRYDGFYGVFHWIKQLVRHQPYACPYQSHLLEKFRLLWIPHQRSGLDADVLADEPIAAWIDLTFHETNDSILKCHVDDETWRGAVRWLPTILDVDAPTLAVDASIVERLPAALRTKPRHVFHLCSPAPRVDFASRSVVETDRIATLVECLMCTLSGWILATGS